MDLKMTFVIISPHTTAYTMESLWARVTPLEPPGEHLRNPRHGSSHELRTKVRLRGPIGGYTGGLWGPVKKHARADLDSSIFSQTSSRVRPYPGFDCICFLEQGPFFGSYQHVLLEAAAIPNATFEEP